MKLGFPCNIDFHSLKIAMRRVNQFKTTSDYQTHKWNRSVCP